MKSTERHKLKQNDFALRVVHARGVVQRRGKYIAVGFAALVLLLVALAAYGWWRSAREARVNERLATALATYEMPVVPPQPPAPGSPPPVPQPGTFQSEDERLAAALPLFLETAQAAPGSDAAVTARFHAASILSAQGKFAEAEQQYRQVVDRAGDGIYGRMARLGLAESQVAQGKYDEAIGIYTEMSRETTSAVPVDAILMQLGRAYARAGRQDEAVRTFTRVSEEFPQSAYAAEARRQLEEVKKS